MLKVEIKFAGDVPSPSPYIAGKVGGKEYRMLLDTGAEFTILDAGIVEGLAGKGLAKKRKSGYGVTLYGINDAEGETLDECACVGVDFGDATTKVELSVDGHVQDLAKAVNFTGGKFEDCPPLLAILGADMMRTVGMRIDFGSCTATIEVTAHGENGDA